MTGAVDIRVPQALICHASIRGGRHRDRAGWESALSTAPLAPDGAASSEILLLRHLRLDLPGDIDREALGRLRGDITALRDGAWRPEGGQRVPDSADAVRFRDRAQLIAWLALAEVQGFGRNRWWRRAALRCAGLVPGRAVLVQAPPALLPTIADDLAQWSGGSAAWEALTPPETAALLQGLVAAFEVPSTASSSVGPGVEAQDALMDVMHIGALNETSTDVSPTTALTIALRVLRQSPQIARNPHFAQWIAGHIAAAKASPTVPHNWNAEPTSDARSRIALTSADEMPMGTTPEPSKLPSDAERTASSQLSHFSVAGTSEEEQTSPESSTTSSKPEFIRAMHPKRQTLREDISALIKSDNREVGQDAANAPSTQVEDHISSALPEPMRTPHASEPDHAPTPETITETRLGGLFYLWRFITAERLTDLAYDWNIGGWALLEVTSRAMLPHLVQTPDMQDPLWALIADLDGRAATDEVGADLPQDKPSTDPKPWQDATFHPSPNLAAWMGKQGPTLATHFAALLDVDCAAAGKALQKPARVHAGPSHVDVTFPLDAADVAVRRAGFDIDPGWVPLLGRVLSFYYV